MLDFKAKPIIGMIHLAGNDSAVARALTEVELYAYLGLAGCIVENYHGGIDDVEAVLKALQNNRPENFEIGINILPNEYKEAFELADRYNASFIQLDAVAGKYLGHKFDNDEYQTSRDSYPNIQVLGGVWPKYYTPVKGSDLVIDVMKGKYSCDAVVCTGSGTGKETPIDKLQSFKKILINKPLIVGAGVTKDNVLAQLSIADGAIVGSAFKPGGVTSARIDVGLIQDFMEVVKQN